MTHRMPARLLAALAAAALLAGCGVKGPPELAGGKTDDFPKVYPEGAIAPDTPPTNIFYERWRDR